MNAMTERVVELREVSKRFGDVEAVKRVTLTLDRGEFLTIVGPSGCGKTTLLRMIAGFEEPSAGEIRINDRNVRALAPHRRSIGMVFQGLALFPHMTVVENIAYPLKMRRFRVDTIPARVETSLQLVRLAGYEDRRPHELSGGQRQRVAIARALSFGPDLLLLDEPLSALDRKLREEMQLEFRRIQQELGVTTINVTHDQREALVMSDTIVVMNNGTIQQTASPVAIYREPQNRFVAQFIGLTSELSGVVESVDGQDLCIRIGSETLSATVEGVALTPGDPVDCAIRAEQMFLLSAEETGFENTVDGVMRQRIFEGDRHNYVIEVEALGRALVHVVDRAMSSHDDVQLGEVVRIGWNAGDMLVFRCTDKSEGGKETHE